MAFIPRLRNGGVSQAEHRVLHTAWRGGGEAKQSIESCTRRGVAEAGFDENRSTHRPPLVTTTTSASAQARQQTSCRPMYQQLLRPGHHTSRAFKTGAVHVEGGRSLGMAGFARTGAQVSIVRASPQPGAHTPRLIQDCCYTPSAHATSVPRRLPNCPLPTSRVPLATYLSDCLTHH